MKKFFLYLVDKLVDFLFAMLGVIVGYYITSWLE